MRGAGEGGGRGGGGTLISASANTFTSSPQRGAKAALFEKEINNLTSHGVSYETLSKEKGGARWAMQRRIG